MTARPALVPRKRAAPDCTCRHWTPAGCVVLSSQVFGYEMAYRRAKPLIVSTCARRSESPRAAKCRRSAFTPAWVCVKMSCRLSGADATASAMRWARRAAASVAASVGTVCPVLDCRQRQARGRRRQRIVSHSDLAKDLGCVDELEPATRVLGRGSPPQALAHQHLIEPRREKLVEGTADLIRSRRAVAEALFGWRRAEHRSNGLPRLQPNLR